MERAIMTVLQFTPAERNFLQEKRAGDTVTWLTNMLGGSEPTPPPPGFTP